MITLVLLSNSIWRLGANHASQHRKMLTQSKNSNLSKMNIGYNFPISNALPVPQHVCKSQQIIKSPFYCVWMSTSRLQNYWEEIPTRHCLQYNTRKSISVFQWKSSCQLEGAYTFQLSSKKRVELSKLLRCYCQTVTMLTETRGHRLEVTPRQTLLPKKELVQYKCRFLGNSELALTQQ